MSNKVNNNLATTEQGDIVHVYPTNDLKPHNLVMGALCGCEPVTQLEFDDDHNCVGVVVVHNSYDGREFFETNHQTDQ